MSALAIVGALAAQAAVPAGTAPPATTVQPSAEPDRGTAAFLDLEAGAGYSTNPELRFGSNTGAGFGRISAHGVYSRISERTSTLLSGFAQNTFYTKHYGSQQSFDLSGRHDARVNEKLRVYGDADFAYDKGGQLDTRILNLPDVPLPPGTIQPPLLIPPGGDFLSVTGRNYRAAGHVGAQLALSARDFLEGSTGIEHSVFKGASLDTRYTTVPVSIGYDRQINPRTTVGARVVAQYTDYNGPTNVRVITPQITLQTTLSERLSFSGAVGVSFASVDDGIHTRHSTGLSANASLCSVGEHGQFCGHVAIDEESPTVAGPARSVSAGIDYSRRLDADQTIQLSANVSRYSSPTSIITSQSFSRATYLRAAADYSRRISNRWFGGVSASARKVLEAGPDPKTDASASLFVRYRLGDVR